jgi:EpsI family protein
LSFNNWLLLKSSDGSWRPAYKNSASEISDIYENGDQKVGLYIGYYRNQFFDRKLISSDNVLVRSEDSHWNVVSRRQNEVKLPEASISVKSSTLNHINGLAGLREQQMDVWYFYWIDGRFTDSDYLTKIYTGISKLLGRGDDAAVIVLHVVREPGIDSEKTLDRFLRENYTQIDELLHAAQAGSSGVVTTIEKS